MLDITFVVGATHSGKTYYILDQFTGEFKVYEVFGFKYTTDGKIIALGDYCREQRDKGIDIYRREKADKIVDRVVTAVRSLSHTELPIYIEGNIKETVIPRIREEHPTVNITVIWLCPSINTIRERIPKELWGSTTGSIIKMSHVKAIKLYNAPGITKKYRVEDYASG